MSRLMRRTTFFALCLALACVATAGAQEVFQQKGADSRVDYASLAKIGQWDDRNYKLTQEDIALFADNEAELGGAVPAFFRIEILKAWPDIQKGVAMYPRSMLNVFLMRHGGYLYEGKLYRKIERRGDRYELLKGQEGFSHERFLETGWEELEKALVGEVRVTNPNGAAESAIKINHTNVNQVVAGTNGPGSGQKMHYSTDGGTTWNQSAALPLGNTCCDPTIDWSLDGSLVYASALGECGSVCDILVYRSSDGGQTWNDLPGSRRRLTTDALNDKQFLHVDKFPTSPHVDNIYLTYHKQNVMQFARSTDFGDTWAIQAFSSATDQRGIGSDIATDKSGNVYYVWPATSSRRILLRKSTDGGASFGSVIEIAPTEASFDFPIPAMETRAAFIYVSVDADLSNGPFADSIYAAWLDTTGPESGTAANNHSRIQVAYSRDGGNTWSLSTPHETADANNVDRFNPWMAVGPDGRVHVIFYDTRRVANRSGTDLFYSSSSDGAQTWTAPVRVTDEISPNIGDGFEFGDYNGMDIVLNDVIGIYTDNRNEGGGSADSVDVYAVGIPVGGACTPQAVANAGADRTINEGDSTTLGTAAQAGHTYSWSPGGATTAQITVSPTATTTYTVTATTSCGSANDSVTVTVLPAGQNGPQVAVYDAGLGAPRCSIAGSECDSTTLLDSRDTLSPAEPNQPNTLDTCTDGTAGSYHSDESNDRIVVRTLDGLDFSEGATVEVAATVWAWTTPSADTVDLYFAADANNPTWTLIGSVSPSASGAQTLTAQYTLPAGSLQAVRANFRYQGAQSSCSGGTYDDADDLVFAVGGGGPECTVDADCDDGAFCNGTETCNAGSCKAGTAVSCDDGVSCTVDSCNEGSDSCDNVATNSLCDNGLFCDGSETCNATLGCQAGSAPNCDDGVSCTVDSCNEGSDSCDNAPDDSACDNGLFCDGAETCNAATGCETGSDPCAGGFCDEVGDICFECNVDADCDDGAFCNGTETCNAGSCQAGSDPCPGQSCDEGGDICVVGGACSHNADFSAGAGGWTGDTGSCSTGDFIVGTPDSTAWQVGSGNPGQAFFTANNAGGIGTDDVDGGTCEALSPVIDCAGQAAAEVTLDYYHGQRDAGDDAGDGFTIEVLNNGTVVDTVVSIGDVTNNAAWTSVSSVVTSPGNIQVRVRVSDATGGGDIVEAGLDNVVIAPTIAPVPCSVEEDFTGGIGSWATSGTCTTGTYVTATPTQQTSTVVTQVGGDHTSGTGNALFTATNSTAGNADVDGGNCIVTSPVFAVTDASDLSVWYFHGQRDAGDDAAGDFFRLEVSTDGGSTYSNLVSIGDVQNVAAWTEATTTIPAGSNVRLRVQTSDGAGPGDIVEGGIDDLAICPQ